MTTIDSLGRNYEVTLNMDNADFDYSGAVVHIESSVGNTPDIV